MATKTATRPSQIVQISNAWEAYQFDRAVILTGTAIENASQELEKVGTGDDVEMKPKYTMQQLLSDDFRLPVSGQPVAKNPATAMRLAAQRHGAYVKVNNNGETK